MLVKTNNKEGYRLVDTNKPSKATDKLVVCPKCSTKDYQMSEATYTYTQRAKIDGEWTVVERHSPLCTYCRAELASPTGNLSHRSRKGQTYRENLYSPIYTLR